MSNYHNAVIAVRNREMWLKVGKAVAETGDDDAIELFKDAVITDTHDGMGNDFVRADWDDYNHWREHGGDEIIKALEDVASDDGYAWFDMDEYGEDSDAVGDEFLGLFYVERKIGSTLMDGKTKAMVDCFLDAEARGLA